MKLEMLRLVPTILLFTVGFSLGMYDPAQGRWVNRDPIAEGGGPNLNAFVANQPLSGTDYLGQLEVTTNLQAPEKVPVIWADDGTISGEHRGATTPGGNVDCHCSCEDAGGKKRVSWIARCTVTTTFTIRMNLRDFRLRQQILNRHHLEMYHNVEWAYWRGIYGHEVAHVRSRNAFVQEMVVDRLARQKDQFKTEDACLEAIGKPRQVLDKAGIDRTPRANGYVQRFNVAMKEAFSGDNHKENGRRRNKYSPGETELLYPPGGLILPRPPGVDTPATIPEGGQ